MASTDARRLSQDDVRITREQRSWVAHKNCRQTVFDCLEPGRLPEIGVAEEADVLLDVEAEPPEPFQLPSRGAATPAIVGGELVVPSPLFPPGLNETEQAVGYGIGHEPIERER